MLRIAFFGTPQFAALVLEELSRAGITPTLIVTSPDAPRGRKLVLTPPEAKQWAVARGIAVLQPVSLKDRTDPVLAPLANSEWDLFVVAAYGKLIPKHILDLPKHGVLNVHPSLLPKFRGASPVRSAILADERVTGVTIMQLDEELDHGPIVAQARVELPEHEWPPRGDVFESLLAHKGGELLADVIPQWVAGTLTAQPQDHTQATYCGKITKDMGLIDLAGDPYQNLLKIRALAGWPGTYFFTEKGGVTTRIKITDATVTDGALDILTVVPEGKKEMPYAQFIASQP